MNYEKAKRALDHLQAERQAQQDRLQHAIDAKRKFDTTKNAVPNCCRWSSPSQR